MEPTREALRKAGNPLRCIIPNCTNVEAHRVKHLYRLCTIHHRQFMAVYYELNLVPLESKEELILEIMSIYMLTLYE